MTADFAEDKVKVRIKFRSGDEFEAEGSPQFIEKQRSEFLQLIKQERSTRTLRRNIPATDSAAPITSVQAAQTALETGMPDDPSFQTQTERQLQALYRRPAAQTPFTAASVQNYNTTQAPTISQGISAAERAALHTADVHGGIHQGRGEGVSAGAPDVRLWEEIIRVEEQMVFLRRKNRLLTPETAAIVLLAGARVLLRQPDGYSALALSKSLKKSGYGGERLDRVLGGAMKLGTVCSVGTKRSRLYYLSEEGFAKAYVLAEKLAELPH